MISGIVKSYYFDLNYVLYDLSYTNMIMLGAVLPSYDDIKDDKGKKKQGKAVNADDPSNRDYVRRVIQGKEF